MKMLIIGLDSTPPSILYEGLGRELENLSSIVHEGSRYILRSSHPPITIPAWAVMVTGKTPGELGLYGFRHRKPGDVNASYIASSKSIKYPAIWDELGSRGLRSIVMSVPPSYPPKRVNGYMISCFITPSTDVSYTWPITLKFELERKFGKYIFDVVYRSEDKDRIIKELWSMTNQHFDIISYLLEKKWDFFMFVEIGVDRVQHAFWKFYDKNHQKYEPGNKYENVIPEYYKLIDKRIGELLNKIPRDTVVIIVSDHGAKPMKGAFCINQWLIEAGYLKLKKEVDKPGIDLTADMIDWSKTIAWGWGGYYSRIFINLEGREPKGIVKRSKYERVIEQLKSDILSIRGPNGERWLNIVYTPEELYPVATGDKPDLIVYLDDLSWRAAGTLGWPSKYLSENDRGPDDAVHDWYGVFTVYDPENRIEKGDLGLINIHEVKGVLMNLL